MIQNTVHATLAGLETILVNQFRSMQELIVVTKREREILSKNDMEALMCVVEEKEALLDQLGLMEDSRRKTIHDLELGMGIQSETSSLEDLLAHIEPDQAGRLSRLRDGITTLVAQARDLNYGNQALATSMIDWLQSAQSFMIGLAQPNFSYRPQDRVPVLEGGGSWGVDHRA